MIKAEHSTFHIWISKVYVFIFLNLFFRNIRFIGDNEFNNELPVLMISNHFSWWDGFFQIRLNDKIFKKKYHFMMLESELSKVRILRKIGATSIKKESRSAFESLQYLVEVIKRPGNLFLFFPEGEIKSLYTQNFEFEKGALNYILKKANNEYNFVFNLNLIDYGAFRRPEVTVYYKTYQINKLTSVYEIQTAYNSFAQDCFRIQKGDQVKE
ncbi:MAG: lysophospholipid acyltransferase family protein [Salibacteraceae bacterium]